MIKKSKVSEDPKKKAPKINLALIIVNTDQYRELKSKKTITVGTLNFFVKQINLA